jgi:RNA polymerase sigma-70 factor (ECF subfamily)
MDSTVDALRTSVTAGTAPDPLADCVESVGAIRSPVPLAMAKTPTADPSGAPSRSDLGDSAGPTEFVQAPESRLSAADLEEWFTGHHAGVFRYAFRLSGRHALAEDLTQQTFMTALSHGGTVRSPPAVRSWLLKVCRRLFLRGLARDGWLASGLETNDLTAKEPSPDSATETRDLLQAGLAALPEEYRVVVLMFFFEDASYQEIAAELGVPVGTVMSRLSRAKARLRSALGTADAKDPA